MAEFEERQDGVLVNALTGMGTTRDRTTATFIGAPEFLNQSDLDSLYLNSWLCRKVVNLWASEATRMGWDIALGDDSKKARKQSDDLVAAGERLRLRKHVRRAVQLARHQGGAVLILMVDDGVQDFAEPINWRRLKRINGLYALDRWRIWPAPGWSGIGQPESYEFNTNRDNDLAVLGLEGAKTVKIHSSRVLRFEGEEVPWRWRSHFNWWGVSVLQPIWEVFKRYETGQTSAAALLNDFDQFVHKIPGLGQMISSGNQEAITRRLEVNQMARSVYRALVLDANEDAQFITRSAAGIADVLDRLTQEVTGASGMPHTKLWGESPSGLGATGRSEDRGFAQDVAEYQEDFLQDPLRQFYETLMKCSEGPFTGEPPEDWRVQFRPTFVMTDEETAALRQQVAAADASYIQAGVLRPNEVALARFGRPEFSLDTTLIDREPDGSIKEEEQDMNQVEFGGDFGQQQGQAQGQPGGEAPGIDGAALAGGPAAGGGQQRPTTDAADQACCASCARGEECEEDCDGSSCEKEDEDPDDPAKHKHPDKVGQVMHRWKHGTLHSGTGKKGEHRGEVSYPKGRKQAIAIALSIAGKSKPRRRAGRRRTVREDAWELPARLKVAGVIVDVGPDGTGHLIGPYGTPTPHQAVVGPDPTGLWEVMDSSGDWFAVVGVADQQALQAAAGPDAMVRRLDSIDLVALGVRCDAYEVED
ncbi:MAG: anti-CBASS Acb1 family protein [Cyanobium sp.]|nr:anti-CBASS Acb1 family protein [Cyanobium sp.]